MNRVDVGDDLAVLSVPPPAGRRQITPADLSWRTADEADLAAALALLDEVTSWLASREVEQWGSAPWTARELEPAIAEGTLFLADSSEVLALVVVDSVADPDFWQTDELVDDAFYLHHLAVARKAAGQQVGGWMIDRAAELARNAGRTYLRLDVARSNTALHHFYRSRGFSHLRTVQRAGRRSGALFERRL